MKKFAFLFITYFTLTLLTSFAGDIPGFRYNNIKYKTKLSYNSDNEKWVKGKTSETYFVKTDGFGEFSAYLNQDGNFAFTTGCEYEFISDGKLYGYSNKDLKFYEFIYSDNSLIKTPLTEENVKTLLPEYKILKISEFSPLTNSIKVKKKFGEFKVLLFNDTEKTFENYYFSSGNAKFKTYPISGIIDILSTGMIQFSKAGENTKKNPWYIILVR